MTEQPVPATVTADKSGRFHYDAGDFHRVDDCYADCPLSGAMWRLRGEMEWVDFRIVPDEVPGINWLVSTHRPSG